MGRHSEEEAPTKGHRVLGEEARGLVVQALQVDLEVQCGEERELEAGLSTLPGLQ